jgi:hypothetical protein
MDALVRSLCILESMLSIMTLGSEVLVSPVMIMILSLMLENRTTEQ